MVVNITVVLVFIIVEFNMARELTSKHNMYVFESLEDVCEFMVHFVVARPSKKSRLSWQPLQVVRSWIAGSFGVMKGEERGSIMNILITSGVS